MRRRDTTGSKVKARGQTALTLKATRRRSSSLAGRETNVARLSRELSEAFEQQAATAEILNVISNSPSDTQPVFDAIVQSGLKLFPGALVSVALRYGDSINAAAVAASDPARVEAWRRTISRTPLARTHMHGAALLDRRIVDIPDVVDAPADLVAGAQNFLTSGNRAITIMPMIRGHEAIGLLSVVRLVAGPLSDKQLALLRTFANQAVIAIENARLLGELRQREQDLTEKSAALAALSSKLAKYLAPQVYDSIFTGQQDVKIVSKRKKLTVCFSDLVGFTEITDKMESEDLTQLLNHYLTEMSKIALQYGATVDKYVGDAIVMFFGDPTTLGVKQDALACVQMAIAMQQRVGELAQEWRSSGIQTPLRCRIGIHTGYCTVGNFGSEDRMDYTMVGGTVNLASRLEHEAAPGEVLISFETYAHVKDEVRCDERGQVQVKGIAQPVATYAVLGPKQDADQGDTAHLRLELDAERMTDDERKAAADTLRRALGLLEKTAKPND
jgi:class 3 adenylate cyclase